MTWNPLPPVHFKAESSLRDGPRDGLAGSDLPARRYPYFCAAGKPVSN
jgi:hypothetical protein